MATTFGMSFTAGSELNGGAIESSFLSPCSKDPLPRSPVTDLLRVMRLSEMTGPGFCVLDKPCVIFTSMWFVTSDPVALGHVRDLRPRRTSSKFTLILAMLNSSGCCVRASPAPATLSDCWDKTSLLLEDCDLKWRSLLLDRKNVAISCNSLCFTNKPSTLSAII